MTNTEYMEKLLALCTPKQKELFCRMYPNGVDKKREKQAITQIERTLKKGDEEIEGHKVKIEELEQKIKEKSAEIYAFQRKVEELEKTPIELKLVGDNDLLNALQACGVDNWNGWDMAMEYLEKNK